MLVHPLAICAPPLPGGVHRCLCTPLFCKRGVHVHLCTPPPLATGLCVMFVAVSFLKVHDSRKSARQSWISTRSTSENEDSLDGIQENIYQVISKILLCDDK